LLPTQRRREILAEVRKTSAVSAEDLALRFGVSVETIRRDLRHMRDRGLLERVYGGALPVQSTEGSFAARSTKHLERKQAIARLAATLVKPDDTIVIDVGTTALEVARALPGDFRGRVLTNSVPVAMELSGNESIELLLSGGHTDYHPHEVATRRVIIAHAGASYVLADSSKLGTVAVRRVCPLAEITAVLTDSDDPQASKEAVDALAAAGCTVLRAT
jgi:DeoR family fructose operon transcriptional repressor